MKTQGTSKLEFFVNLFNNLFNKKNIIILIGRNGIDLSVLRENKVVNNIFIENGAENFQKKYSKFLTKYKSYNVVFLLDDKNCTLRHEVMPMLSSIIKTNPIENFIEKNYQPTDLVAYNIYDITNQNGEIWNASIVSRPFIYPLNELLEYVINNSFKFSGVYFLALEFKTLIDKLLQKTQNTEYLNHLQIFVTLTKSSGIKIIVKYKQNIMEQQTIEYPYDKSDMYVQGTIEQAITDKLIFYKAFIEKLKLQTCIITLSDKKLQNLLKTLEFDNCKILALTGEKISISKQKKDSRFQENSLLEIFYNSNTHLALNKSLKSITKLTLLNNIIFKPIIIAILGICITLATIKYKSIKIYTETKKYNQEYYSFSEEYRNIQKMHLELKHANDLIELYNLENLINKTTITPFDHLRSIFIFNKPKLKIKKITWEIIDPQTIDLLKNKLRITINYQYEGPRQTVLQGVEFVNAYYSHISSIFSENNLKLERNSKDILEIAKKVIVPAKITFEGIVEKEKDVK